MGLYEIIRGLYDSNEQIREVYTFEEYVDNFMVENYCVGGLRELIIADDVSGMYMQEGYLLEDNKIIYPILLPVD